VKKHDPNGVQARSSDEAASIDQLVTLL